jgi:ribosomal protein S18 acetylase RimI-like enzyme
VTAKESRMEHETLRSQRPSQALRQEGIRLLAVKVLTTFYRRMLLMVRPLDDAIPSLRPRLSVVFKVLTEEDLLVYSRSRSDPCVDLSPTRSARKEQYFAALYEGRIVQVGRVATGRVYVPYLCCDLILQPSDVYVYGSFTLPAFRGYGLAPARAVHMMHHYRHQGYQHMVCLVAVENKSGLRVVEKLGYRSVGLYSYLRFGLWQHHWQQTWGEEPLPRLAKAE